MESLQKLLRETRAALMVVDVQNDYCHPEGALAKNLCDVSGVRAMMPRLHELLTAARGGGLPVIFIRTVHDDCTNSAIWKNRAGGRLTGVCRPGSWGADFFEVRPRDGELVVSKFRYSAFIGTQLDMILRAQRIGTLLIAGVSTNVCVESTARDGCMLDYRIVLVGDACAAYSQHAHEMTLRNIQDYFGYIARAEEIAEALKPRNKAGYKLAARL